MSSPTKNAQTALKHLLKYLLDGQHHGLLLCRDNVHCGRSGELSPSTSRAMCIESYSDADWATHKGNRRSVSSSTVFVSGCLLYSSARTQRVIALSSGESELLSATSSLCDALFIRQLVAFLGDCDPPQVHHFTDATAAKSMMERSGVGRVRHLSVRVLWTQQLVADKVIALHKVDTCRNVADLNTKALPRHRMMMLLNLLGGWDTLRDEPIGLNDIAEFEYKQAMKQAVRAVRTTTSGVSIIDMLAPHAATILCMCILILFVAMCFRVWCAGSTPRQVQVQVSDQRQHGAVSVKFDQNLNVHVGVAAPGTPANPLAVDSDDNTVRVAMSQRLPVTPPQDLCHLLQNLLCERQAQRRLRQRVQLVRRDRSGRRMVTRLQLPAGWSIPGIQCGSARMAGATIDCDASSLMGVIASSEFLLQMPLHEATDHARSVHLE
ncbi:unnamed protein product, partial [Symbiodinium necroappetens]